MSSESSNHSFSHFRNTVSGLLDGQAYVKVLNNSSTTDDYFTLDWELYLPTFILAGFFPADNVIPYDKISCYKGNETVDTELLGKMAEINTHLDSIMELINLSSPKHRLNLLYALPLGHYNLVRMSMNSKELMNFFNKSIDNQESKEIRDISMAMLSLAEQFFPIALSNWRSKRNIILSSYENANQHQGSTRKTPTEPKRSPPKVIIHTHHRNASEEVKQEQVPETDTSIYDKVDITIKEKEIIPFGARSARLMSTPIEPTSVVVEPTPVEPPVVEATPVEPPVVVEPTPVEPPVVVEATLADIKPVENVEKTTNKKREEEEPKPKKTKTVKKQESSSEEAPKPKIRAFSPKKVLKVAPASPRPSSPKPSKIIIKKSKDDSSSEEDTITVTKTKSPKVSPPPASSPVRRPIKIEPSSPAKKPDRMPSK